MTDGQMMDGSVQLDPGGCCLSQVSTLELCLGDISLGTGVAHLRAMGQVDPEGNRPGLQRRKLSLAGR